MIDSTSLSVDSTELKATFTRAMDDALVVHHPSPGLLQLTGSSSLDLLNRMSTNNLADMSPSTTAETVLTTPHARIVDLIRILHRSEDMLVMTSPERGKQVQEWLQQHIFFQDDVKVSSIYADWSHWGVYGPEARPLIQSVRPDSDLPNGTRISAREWLITWQVESPAPGYHLLMDPDTTAQFQRHQATNQDQTLAEKAYQILRIQTGMPQSPNEINDNYIPLELGLWDIVSFSKGCYTGQEIIARMESRGKVARHLVGIQLTDRASPGSSIYHGARKLGLLTSIIFSPSQGWIGLGVVKPVAEDAARVTLSIGENGVQGKFFEFS